MNKEEEIIKIRVKTNEIEIKKPTPIINKTKTFFQRKQANLIKKKNNSYNLNDKSRGSKDQR